LSYGPRPQALYRPFKEASKRAEGQNGADAE